MDEEPNLASEFPMSSPIDPPADAPRGPLPPRVIPVYPGPYAPTTPRSSVGRVFLVLFLLSSVALNVLLICGGYFLGGLLDSEPSDGPPRERFYSGNADAKDRIAVIRIDGSIVDGQLSYEHRQIEAAAQNPNVKAVVVRIDSPGGTISASDDLHRRLIQLRDGTTRKFQARGTSSKPLVASMGGIAASGGYYVAMPAATGAGPVAKKLFAERTTITGSIGVYSTFLQAEELAKRYGVGMELIKAGSVKGSGSWFHRMTPQERQPFADMVDHAYQQFIEVVEAGRPQLQGKLTEDLFPPKTIPVYDDRGDVVKNEAGQPKTTTYTRQRADGGIFTAEEALKWGLIDAIGTLDDAVAEAAKLAMITNYRAIIYERPISLMGLLTGSQASTRPDFGQIATGLGPRVWYLAPGAEMNALVNIFGRSQ
jgi:protease-4